MLNRFNSLVAGAAVLAAMALPGSALAQSAYPEKPVRLILSSAAGGSVDALTRQLAPFWEKTLGQRLEIENKGGAGGITGVRYFMEQPDDGYAVLIGTEAHFGGAVEKGGLSADEIVLINMHQYDPSGFVVTEGSRFTSFEDLIKEAQEKPDTITWGTPATGSSALMGKLVLKNFGVNLRFVPQDGGTEADTALLGGHIDVKSGSIAGDYAELSGIRYLAVAADERLPFAPDVPTINEVAEKLGKEKIPSFGTSRMIAVHASMKEKHPEFFQKLAETYKAAFNDPEYQAKLKETGQANATTFYEPDEATALFRQLIDNGMKYRKEFGGS